MSQSLVGTTSLIAQIPAPEITVPEYTSSNPDIEGNYYGSSTGMQGGCFDGRFFYQSFVKYCYNQNTAYDNYNHINNEKNIVVIVKYDMFLIK